jgi:glycosyltransferase involved in cell wall biosynthesis
LTSLRAQTFGDWVCEVHNDEPTDAGPSAVVSEFKDPRIHLVTHRENLGPVETFNLVFRGATESFYSLLEDDNWWEPGFLAQMVATLEEHPSAVVAWCNQQIWRESTDGSWIPAGTTVRPETDSAAQLVQWGHPRQALGALHANGAMLIRSRPGEAFPVSDIPFTAVEAVRERLLPHPMVYVPQPLAIYAVTQTTARRNDRSDWFTMQCVLLATFVRHAPHRQHCISALWTHYRADRPSPTNVLLCAALISSECRPILAGARWGDWYRLARSALGHPMSIWNALRVHQRHPEWWTLLDKATAARWAEAPHATGVKGARDAVPAL